MALKSVRHAHAEWWEHHLITLLLCHANPFLGKQQVVKMSIEILQAALGVCLTRLLCLNRCCPTCSASMVAMTCTIPGKPFTRLNCSSRYSNTVPNHRWSTALPRVPLMFRSVCRTRENMRSIELLDISVLHSHAAPSVNGASGTPRRPPGWNPQPIRSWFVATLPAPTASLGVGITRLLQRGGTLAMRFFSVRLRQCRCTFWLLWSTQF